MQIDTMANIFVGGAFLFLYCSGGNPVNGPLPANASFEKRMQRRFDPYCKGIIAACLAMLGMQAMFGSTSGMDSLQDAIMEMAVLMALPLLAVIILPFTMGFGVILRITPLPTYAVHILTGSLSAIALPCAAALMGRGPLTAPNMLMFSLAGIPPLAGFWAKWYTFGAAVEAGLIWLLVIATVAAVISAFYYLRLVKIMVFDDAADEFDGPMGGEFRVVLGLSAAVMLLFVVGGLGITEMAADAATIYAR